MFLISELQVIPWMANILNNSQYKHTGLFWCEGDIVNTCHNEKKLRKLSLRIEQIEFSFGIYKINWSIQVCPFHKFVEMGDSTGDLHVEMFAASTL